MICPACQATVEYISAATGCWQLQHHLLEPEYQSQSSFTRRLLADAYAVQHPDGDDPRQLQLVRGWHVALQKIKTNLLSWSVLNILVV